MFGFGLHKVPPVGDMSKNNPKRGNSQLLVLLGIFYFDSRVDVASLNQPLFWSGVTVENV